MKRRIALLVAILLSCSAASSAKAYESAGSHWNDMKLILFGNSQLAIGTPQQIRTKVQMLNSAASFVTDNHSKTGQNRLDYLDKNGVNGVKSLSAYDYSATPDTHRGYTHLGWDYDYSLSCNPGVANAEWSREKWPERKRLLLSTVDKVFGFSGFLPTFLFGYSEKCDSFAALTYYIHILGDHNAIKDISNYNLKSNQLMSLAGRKHPEGMDCQKRSIIPEIIHHLDILIDNKNGDYLFLIDRLDDLNARATPLSYVEGEITTQKQFDEYKAIISELIKILSDHLPTILKNEPFFANVFYN